MRILLITLMIVLSMSAQANFFELLIPKDEPDPDPDEQAHVMICFNRGGLKQALQVIDHYDGFYLRYIDKDQARAIRRAGCKLGKLPVGTDGYSSGYYKTTIRTEEKKKKSFIFSLYQITLPNSKSNRYIAERMYPGNLFRIVDNRKIPEGRSDCPENRRWCLEPVDCSVQNSNIGAFVQNNGDALSLDCRKRQF